MTKWTDELQTAYQAGADSVKVANSRTNTGGVTGGEFVIPKEGPGGYDENPYDDFGDYRGPIVPGHPDWAGELQINPEIATLLPGEKGTTGGLGTMNREALDRYIKENNISGAAAGKLIKKWQGLHGGVNLPLAHNAPVWPGHKWPHPTPGQGPLPNPNLPQNITQVNYGQPSALDKLLGPNQGQGGSLRHMNDKERIDLLIRGTKTT